MPQGLYVGLSTGNVGIGNTQNARYINYANNVLPPSADGLINGVSITALNKRTRTSAAAATDCVRTWVTRLNAAENLWNSVCWAPELSLFVAVASSGTGNRVMTSSDGIIWTTRLSATDNNWLSVCWAPEISLFVAVASGTGSGNRVMTSPDGITWATRASAADNLWSSVCWSPELSLFVAVAESGTGNRIMTSSNGIAWTTRKPAVDNDWFSVCWAAELSLFVAVAKSGTGNRVMTSPDGINWTTQASAANTTWKSVCWAPEISLLAAVSDTGTKLVMTSPDGITWTTRASAADNNWLTICWAPQLSLFVATAWSGTGNRIMTSLDGITWTTRPSNNNSWTSICWAPELSTFVAVGNGGTGTRVMTSAIGMPNAKSVVKALPSQITVLANGNVGIGTTSPLTKLHMNGTVIIANEDLYDNSSDPTDKGILRILSYKGTLNNGDGGIEFKSSTYQNGYGFRIVNGTDYDTSGVILSIQSRANSTAWTDRMIFTQDGSVGIGLTNPVHRLDVNGTTYLTSGIRTGTGSYIYNRGGGAGFGQVDNVWLACGGVGRSPAFIYTGGDQFDIYAGGGGVYASYGFFSLVTNAGIIDFTGQHRSHNAHSLTLEHVGLILISSGIYKNLNGSNLPSINEALPIVELAKTPMDKRVYGVLSDKEEDGKREYELGRFVSVFQKEEGDNRLIINSLGEGGIWVCDANGNFSNGDYITSSAVVGYGMRQDDDLLHSYTVAKITMDCDFTSNIIEHNQIRYLQADGTIITKDTYNTKKSINEPVYVAVFVGCTYHCG